MKRTTKKQLAARLTSGPAQQAEYVRSYTLTMLWHTLGDTLCTPEQYQMSSVRMDTLARLRARGIHIGDQVLRTDVDGTPLASERFTYTVTNAYARHFGLVVLTLSEPNSLGQTEIVWEIRQLVPANTR